MAFLAPEKGKSGKSTGPCIVVSGKQIRFNKETAQAIGLKDHVNVYIGEEEDGEANRMYFLTGADASRFKLNGKEGKVRVFADANVVTVGRLGSDTYPLAQETKSKTKGWYLEFNPNNPIPSMKKPERKVRTTPAKLSGDINKATAGSGIKPNPAGGVKKPNPVK